MPFLHALLIGKFLPTFLVFFHEPIFQIVQLPMMIFGASQFFVRLPNYIFGIIYFLALYKLGRLMFGKKNLYILTLVALYMASSYQRVFRAELNHVLFNLVLTTCLYYLIKFDKKRLLKDFVSSYKLFLLNVFVYIDVLFAGLGFIAVLLYTKVNKAEIFSKKLVVPTIVACTFFIAWSFSVYAGAIATRAYSWQQQAPFSLLNRGTSYSLSAIADNANLFRTDTAPEYLIFICVFLLISIFDKRSRPVWVLLAGPLIYFNVVKMPTVHLFNFITLIFVGTTIGMRATIERFPKLKYFVIMFLVLSLVKNVILSSFSNPLGADLDYKMAATFLRRITTPCDKVFIRTSLDGSAFRFYFDRGYTTEVTNLTNVAFVDGDSSYLESNGFGKIAEVKRNNKINLSIYQKGYKGDTSELNSVNTKLFNFSNTLTYISECYYKK